MDEPIGIEELYFDWLCAKVRPEDSPFSLEFFRILHSHPFPDQGGLDENRVADAKELREYFLAEGSLTVHMDWVDQDCSVLELLVSFADKAAFQIELPIETWFWQFITNLRLDNYMRPSRSDERMIRIILDRFVLRDYGPDGDGGLFPLRRPLRDQREVEIWYQFCDYVEDNGLLYGLV